MRKLAVVCLLALGPLSGLLLTPTKAEACLSCVPVGGQQTCQLTLNGHDDCFISNGICFYFGTCLQN